METLLSSLFVVYRCVKVSAVHLLTVNKQINKLIGVTSL